MQSDPLGTDAGINTYLYVMANPLSGVDLLGLETLPGSGKPKNYPNCFKWPGFPPKGCECADRVRRVNSKPAETASRTVAGGTFSHRVKPLFWARAVR